MEAKLKIALSPKGDKAMGGFREIRSVNRNQRYEVPKEISNIMASMDDKIIEGTEDQRSSKPLSPVISKSSKKQSKRKLVIQSPMRKK